MTTTLRDITLQCPICATWFASRAVAESGAVAGTRTDFHRRIDEPQPLAYEVHMCSGCGFAALEEEFGTDDVSTQSVGGPPSDRGSLATCQTIVASEKYEAAAAIADRRGAGPRAVADLLVRAAWCCVDEGDVEAERYFRRKAAGALESALSRYDEVPRDERAVLTYLVGELWRRVGDAARAAAWFERVGEEVSDPRAQCWIVALALQQRNRPREWLI